MLLPDLLMKTIFQFHVADRLLDFPSRGYAPVPPIESEVGFYKGVAIAAPGWLPVLKNPFAAAQNELEEMCRRKFG